MDSAVHSLTDESCRDFTAALAARTSVPGGGGAAALAGALGAALCSMAGNFTAGKKKHAAHEADIRRVLRKAEELRLRLLTLIDEDAAAFAPLSRAYGIPKDSPDRAEILENAAWNACQAPAEMAKCCAEMVPLLEELLEKGSALLASDVGCGALLCAAAMEAAAMNVYVNTAGLRKNSDVRQMEETVDELLRDCLPRARAVAEQVRRRLRE